MTHAENVEYFWSKIAVCKHGRTCRRCCWGWLGKTAGNYALWYPVNGRGVGAHKFMLELVHGACVLPNLTGTGPKKLRFVILHRCKTLPCHQPAHLHIGTNRDNTCDWLWPRLGKA